MPKSRYVGPLSAFAVFGLFWGAFAALLPQIKTGTAVSDGELGLGFLALGIAALPAILGTGWLIDRRGWPTLRVALVLFAVAALLPAFAASLPGLVLSFAVLGAAAGSIDAASNAATSELESSGRRLMHLAHAVNALGVVVGAGATGLIRAFDVDRLPILAGVAAIILLAAALNRDGGSAATTRPSLATHGVALPRWPLITLGVLFALAEVLESSVDAWSAIHLEETLGAGPAVGGLGPAAFAGALVVGRLLALVVERHVTDRLFLAAGATFSGVGVGTAALADSALVAVAGFALAGLGYSVVVPIIYRLAGVAGGAKRRGIAISGVATIGAVGYTVGPALVGGVAEIAGLRVGLLLLVGAALVLGVVALVSERIGRLSG